jgi:hypothetical protein
MLTSRIPSQKGNRFGLEALEPRVLLSGDGLLVSAVATNALAHRPVEVVHHDSASGAPTFHDSISHHPANAQVEMFAGLASEPALSQTTVSAAAPATHSGDQGRTNPVQNSERAVRPVSEAKQDIVSTPSSARISTASPPVSSTQISAGANPMTQQLTASLTAANGPPANAVASQPPINQSVAAPSSSSNGSGNGAFHAALGAAGTIDLLQSITADLNTFGSADNTAPLPINLGDATLAGILSAHGISLSFSGLTISSGAVTAGTVTITATSAGLNLGGAATSSIGAITGSYDIASKAFSLTLNSVSLAFSSFVSVSANSASLAYTSATNTTAALSDGTTASVSLLTVGISNASVFAGVNGPASNANAEGLSLTGANLALALMQGGSQSLAQGAGGEWFRIKWLALPP